MSPITPVLPRYQVKAGLSAATDDITNLIDLDSLHRVLSNRGEASCEFDIPVYEINDVPSNVVVQDSVLEVWIDDELEWKGFIVAVHPPAANELVMVVHCAGTWEKLSHRTDYCKGFLECRTELFQQMDPTLFPAVGLGTSALINMEAATVDTSGQLLITVPDGSSVKAGQGIYVALNILDGMDANALISNTVGRFAMSPTLYTYFAVFAWLANSPWSSPTQMLAMPSANGTFSFAPLIHVTNTDKCFCMAIQALGNVASTAQEDFVQLRNIQFYVDRVFAPITPTVDTAVYDIVQEVVPSAVTNATTQTIGSPLSQLMVDPHTTAADAIQSDILPRALFPPQCGISRGNLVCIPGSTAPPDPRRLWQVSEVLTPGLQWDVAPDDENRVECVAATYNVLGVNSCLVPENDDITTTWPNYAGGWDYVSATNTLVFSAGGGVYQFSVVSNSLNKNPSTTYPQGQYLTIVPGLDYRMNCLAYLTSYGTGNARIGVIWYDNSYAEISRSLVMNLSAAFATETALTGVFPAPATAAYAKLVVYWYNVSTVGPYAIRVRHIDFRPAMPDGALQKLYYPAAPASFASRVGLLDVGDATYADALTAAQQAFYWWNIPQGTATVPYAVLNSLGQSVYADHIRQWDWIQNTGIIDPKKAGPFMITDVDHQGGIAQITVGNTDGYKYMGADREATKGRYIAAHRKRVKYRKREAFSTWWHATHKKGKNGRYPAMPKKHPKYKWVTAYKYVNVAGHYA